LNARGGSLMNFRRNSTNLKEGADETDYDEEEEIEG
jgi:hypothetical protein